MVRRAASNHTLIPHPHTPSLHSTGTPPCRYDEHGNAQSEMRFGDNGHGERFLVFLDGDKETHEAARQCELPVTLTLRHKQLNGGGEGGYGSASVGGPPTVAGELDVLLKQRVAAAIEDSLESFRNGVWEAQRRAKQEATGVIEGLMSLFSGKGEAEGVVEDHEQAEAAAADTTLGQGKLDLSMDLKQCKPREVIK